MSNLVTIPYYQGALSVDDLSNLLAVKMFLPFTNDLLDKSESHHTVTNVGNVELGNNGAMFNGSNYLKTSFNFQIMNDYTFELIILVPNTVDTYSAIMGGNNANGSIQCGFNTGWTLSFGTQGVSGGGVGASLEKYKGQYIHVAITYTSNKKIKVFVNGELYISGDVSSIINCTELVIGRVMYTELYKYVGIIGGFKITQKTLELSQFSLLRPMTIPYPTFKVGNKEYIYKAGILNPKYTTSITGSVIMNASSIRVNAAGKITFNGVVKGNVFAKVAPVGTTQGSVYLQSIKGSVVSTFIAITSNNYNLTELIFGTYFDNNSFLLQSAESSPIFDILELWIE